MQSNINLEIAHLLNIENTFTYDAACFTEISLSFNSGTLPRQHLKDLASMRELQTGQFFGQTNNTIHLDGITLTDTEYTHDKVDWHYHENAYFTFILKGNVIEGNKKEVYQCSAGSLLFHNWQETHYNIKPTGFTRGFHIELERQWIKEFVVNTSDLQGSIHLTNPDLKLLMYNIFKETKINDETSSLSIQDLLLQALAGMQRIAAIPENGKPAWVKKLNELLHDQCGEKNSLQDLSDSVGIHPVYLSRIFSKYFHCGVGDYIRKLKIEKSLSLLADKRNSLIDITFDCGFSDQSHFNRCFKGITGISPLAYRRIFFS